MDNFNKKFYVTTPIYYPSGEPHLGHGYCSIAADVIARYKRLLGYDVMFLTGTDEHGQKIEHAAQKKGIRPKEYVDEVSQKFRNLWKVLDISNDIFMRTTDSYHEISVGKIFKKLYDNGDIYKSYYKGLYCEPCESFFTKTQVKDGNLCPDCGREVKYTEEEAYFFRLSKYTDKILKLYRDNPQFIKPVSCYNEMLKFVESGLDDLCVSRTTFSWGIKVPFDPGHVVYVWIDALTNYITALGYENAGTEEELINFKKFWPADVHIVGKEIMRFHAVTWIAILMALGLELPKCIFGHGWLLFKDGTKMSKSKGNVVSPLDLMNKYSVNCDAVRYFLLREFPFGHDGNFGFDTFVNRVNSDLANDLGNLVSRTTSMILKYTGDGFLNLSKVLLGPLDNELINKFRTTKESYCDLMDSYKFSEVLSSVWTVVCFANKYIEAVAPWALYSSKKTEELYSVLYLLCEIIRCVSILVGPFMPQTSEKIFSQLGVVDDSLKTFESAEINAYSNLLSYAINKEKEILFPRVQV